MDAAIEDLMMQAKKIKYDVIGLTEMRRRHPLNAGYETREQVFLGACDSREVEQLVALQISDGITTASRRTMEKVINNFCSDLFNSHVHLPPHHQREDKHVILGVLPSEFRHAIMSVKNLHPVPTESGPNI